MLEMVFLKTLDFNHVRLFAASYCGAIALQIVYSFRDQLRYLATRPTDFEPMRPLGVIPLPLLGRVSFATTGAALIAFLLLIAAGVRPYLFIALALPTYFLYFGQIATLAYVRKKTHVVPLVLIVLLASPGLNSRFTVEAPAWPLLLIELIIAQVYFSAGYEKLRSAGWRWADGRTLQAALLRHHLWGDMRVALALARRPRLCALASAVVLAFELTFWVILVVPALTPIYVALGLGFHTATAVAMRIYFVKYFVPVYLVFATGWMAALLAAFA